MTSVPVLLKAYSGLMTILSPAASLVLKRRLKRGKEHPVRLGERKGIAGLPRPKGPVIWLHGASVGELISLLPIAENMTSKGRNVLVTSGTVTSAEIAERRLPSGAIHQFIPLDVPAYVRRFIAHWQPDVGVFAESEIWPNLVREAHASGTHLVMVNARMSERSFRRWHRFPSLITALLQRYELTLAQTEADAERLRALQAPRVQVIGNLKYDVAPPPVKADTLQAMQDTIGRRRVFVAASTHPGEEEQIAAAHMAARSSMPDLLTIIIPRHPERGASVADMLVTQGLSVGRRSADQWPDAKTDIYVADTIGELGLFYRLTRLSFLGGSLVAHGGQNPIEPAKLGNAILHGPHFHNFTEVYGLLDEAHGAFQVSDAEELGRAVARLLSDGAALGEMAGLAEAEVMRMSGANQRAIAALEPLVLQAHVRRGQAVDS
jgi:3-deoxy-D-manno-octulosonic-acid transferase